MKNRKIFNSIIVALTLCLLFASCSNKTNNRARSNDKSVNAAENPQTEQVTRETAAGMALYEDSYTAEDCYIEDEMAYNSSNGEFTNSIENSNLPNNQMLIRTMSITADTVDFTGLTSMIDSAVNNYGGYYDSMNISGTGTDNDYRRGSYVIKIPAENLDAFVSSFSGNLTITNRSENTTDVTLDYVDTESRLESLRIEQDNLLEMLDNCEDMESIIYLQNELSSIRYQIESYESQLRVMMNQVNYSTLYLTLNEVIEEIPEEPIEVRREKTFSDKIKETLSESVANLKEYSQDALLWLVSVLPYIGIFCIIILIFTIVFVIRKSIHKKNKDKSTNNKK